MPSSMFYSGELKRLFAEEPATVAREHLRPLIVVSTGSTFNTTGTAATRVAELPSDELTFSVTKGHGRELFAHSSA